MIKTLNQCEANLYSLLATLRGFRRPNHLPDRSDSSDPAQTIRLDRGLLQTSSGGETVQHEVVGHQGRRLIRSMPEVRR